MRILRRLFGPAEPTPAEIGKYAATLSEARAREIMGTSRFAGDGTDPEKLKRAAGYALAKADIDGMSFEFSLAVKYRGKSDDEAAGLLTEEEIEGLLKIAKIRRSEDPAVRRSDAALAFSAVRLLSPYE